MLKLYFLELRSRLVLVILFWMLTFVSSYCCKETLLYIIIKPYINLYPDEFHYFIATDITEIFSSYVFISLFVANQLSVFFILYHLLAFFCPALYVTEYRLVRNLVIYSFIFWVANILVLNKFILTRVFTFFIQFQESGVTQAYSLHFEARIIKYLELYKTVFMCSAFVFQMFLVIIFFLSLLRDKIKFLRSYRKIFYYLFFVIATLISPPEVVSQLFLGISFIFFFEVVNIFLILLDNVKNVREKSH